MKFRVKAKDLVLYTNKVFILNADSKEELLEGIKSSHPHISIIEIEEVEDAD